METIVFHIDAFWTRDSYTSSAKIKATMASELLQCYIQYSKSTFFLETKEYPLSEL